MRRVLPVLLLLAAACAHDLWVADRLYFGRAIPGGGMVSDAEWEAFVRDVVTPRFPDGLTIHAAHGQWREAGGAIVREPVMIIEIVHPRSVGAEEAVEEIMRIYRDRFRQEAVLRVRSRARVSFQP